MPLNLSSHCPWAWIDVGSDKEITFGCSLFDSRAVMYDFHVLVDASSDGTGTGSDGPEIVPQLPGVRYVISCASEGAGAAGSRDGLVTTD